MLNSSFKKPFHLRLIFTMDKNSSDGVPLPQRYGAILTIVLGLTMAVLDGAIANVALPTIASDLNASPAASIGSLTPTKSPLSSPCYRSLSSAIWSAIAASIR